MAAIVSKGGPVRSATGPRPAFVSRPTSDDARTTLPSTRRPAAPVPPWFEAPEFRALAEVRRAFVVKGVPPAAVRTPEAGARQAAYWMLYELGHALDEIERRTRAGSPCWSRVRVAEHGPGRVVIDIAVEPIPEPSPSVGGGEGGDGA